MITMDSGSDEEFFDAAEEFSPNKALKDQKSISLESQNPTATVASNLNQTSELSKTDDNNQLSLSQDNLEKERDNIIIKDNTIERVQNENRTEKLKNDPTNNDNIKEKRASNNNSEKTINETTDTNVNEQCVNSTDVNEKLKKNDSSVTAESVEGKTEKLEKSTVPKTPPAPVAPPRRKKRGNKKKEPKQVEVKDISPVESPKRSSTDIHTPTNLSPDIHQGTTEYENDRRDTVTEQQQNNENAPCIKVSSSLTEMKEVLESGNSLEVVFNEDLLTRKSGGIPSSCSSVSNSPATNKANLVRCNSISGNPLTDAEILEGVIIKNLDTGESIPLSLAEEKIQQCTNPLALHILRVATENESDQLLGKEEEDGNLSDTSSIASGKLQDKRKKLKKFLGKTVQKIRSVADEVTGQGRRADESSSDEEEQQHSDEGGFIKFKNHRAIKDKLMFNRIRLLQDLSGEHIGAVWTMKFSLCGKLLATAGQDNIVRVWVLKESASNFEEMRLKYSRQPTGRSSPTGSMTSATSTSSGNGDDPLIEDLLLARGVDDEHNNGPFKKTPFVSYHGHTSDVLDLSWSKDDRYFLSGSLDGKIRLWNIPEKKVALWNEIDGSGTSLVTAANFCQNGKLAVVGTYDGRCIFYDTERLKYHTQVTVRSSRGKNARGRKISGIEPMPGEDKVLITSNDSRIRLYDLKDHSLSCKYKGLQNESSQIKASFSHDGKMILCGSEDKFVYIWRTQHEVANVRTDRNEYYESFSAHDAVVTAGIFAPYPTVIVENPSAQENAESASVTSPSSSSSSNQKPFEVLVAADWEGGVKLYVNR